MQSNTVLHVVPFSGNRGFVSRCLGWIQNVPGHAGLRRCAERLASRSPNSDGMHRCDHRLAPHDPKERGIGASPSLAPLAARADGRDRCGSCLDRRISHLSSHDHDDGSHESRFDPPARRAAPRLRPWARGRRRFGSFTAPRPGVRCSTARSRQSCSDSEPVHQERARSWLETDRPGRSANARPQAQSKMLAS